MTNKRLINLDKAAMIEGAKEWSRDFMHPSLVALAKRFLTISRQWRNVVHVRAYTPYRSRRLWVHNLAGKTCVFFNDRRVRGAWGGRPDAFAAGLNSVKVSESLPNLAWLAQLSQSGWEFRVGPQVTVGPRGIFEGVWDGTFDDWRPDQSRYAFGSGAVEVDGEIVFVTPKHPWECLFLLQSRDNGPIVSNSLAFLLSSSGLDVSSEFFALIASRLHDHALKQGRRGVDRMQPLVALNEEFALYQCSYFNFTVDAVGRPIRRWFPAVREFTTFDDYIHLLESTLVALFTNGTAANRRLPLEPVATVSTGYDSTAVAAIAKRAGCRRAVTLKVQVYGQDDSGKSVAEELDLPVVEHQHVMGSSIDQLNIDASQFMFDQAAEFIATYGVGDDVTFLPFEVNLRQGILLTGQWGDSIWKRGTRTTSGLPTGGRYGRSLNEFRLRVGFAHVPVPVIGGRYSEPIHKLSLEPKMQAFSIGGEYDRPIPRRIAEEAGIPRAAFGYRKAATAPWLMDHAALFPAAMNVVMRRYTEAEAG